MVDRNVSITQSVTKSASVTQSVTRAVSIDETIDSSPYDGISATNPSTFVPLKYASTTADGQILYQDSAATTPVTTAGDPVGAVVWDGSTVASQPTDANRPIWQGVSRGVAFNGTDQFLEGTVGAWLTGDATLTVVARLNPDAYGSAPNERGAWGLGAEAGTAREVAALCYESNTDTALRLSGGNAVYDALPLTDHVASARYQGGGAVWELWEDGVAASLQSSSAGVHNFSAQDLRIGRMAAGIIPTQPFFSGDIQAIGIYNPDLNDTERTAAEDAFGAL